MKHRLCTAIALLALTCSEANSADPTPDDTLRAGLYETILARIEPALRAHPPAPNLSEAELNERIKSLANGATDCSMKAIHMYPEAIIQIGYQTMSKGGSYPDAKEAMELAARNEMLAGGEREASMEATVKAMGDESTECLRRLSTGS